MEFRRPLIYLCILLPALVAGCRQNHAARELLERELRLQEDRIYELEAELEDVHRALCAIKQSPGGNELRDRSPVTSPDAPRTFDPPASTLAPPTSIGPPPSVDLGPPSVELPPPSATMPGSAPKFQGPPAIVPPSADVPEGLPGRVVPMPPATRPDGASAGALPYKSMSSPKFLSPSVKGNPVFDSSAPVVSGVSPVAPPSAATTSAADTRLKTASLARTTRGVNLDGRPGDDGVLVVVEARNARGEAIPPNAAASLVLIDPAVPGEGGRYARWDFSADDTAALFREANGDAAAGSYFELPWPDAPPAHSRLKLFVRLTTSDGKQIQLDRDVTVDVGGGTSQQVAPPQLAPSQFVAPTTPSATLSTIVPTAAQGEMGAEAGLRWGRRDAETTAAVPYVEALPVSNVAEPVPFGNFAPENVTPVETPAGPLLFPADASLGSPEMLPRR